VKFLSKVLAIVPLCIVFSVACSILILICLDQINNFVSLRFFGIEGLTFLFLFCFIYFFSYMINIIDNEGEI
jgi:O-antigen ligase